MVFLNVVLAMMVALAGLKETEGFLFGGGLDILVVMCRLQVQLGRLATSNDDCDGLRAQVECYIKAGGSSNADHDVISHVKAIFRAEYLDRWDRCDLNISEIIEKLRGSGGSHPGHPGPKPGCGCNGRSTKTTPTPAAPTTKSTAAPTTKSTAAPTTESTAAPTTKSTAAPTTACPPKSYLANTTQVCIDSTDLFCICNPNGIYRFCDRDYCLQGYSAACAGEIMQLRKCISDNVFYESEESGCVDDSSICPR